ncbi:MAG: hypothetical protein ABSF09_14340 [Candidatus Bathyarchaeia archaeon]
MRRRTRNSTYVIVFAILATVIVSSGAYVMLNAPPPERFFAMWILGSNGLAEHYYPNDNPNITVNEPVNWTLNVYNHMPSLEYVVVRVKLLNSTMASPNETTGTPSPSSSLIEFTHVLISNQTWSFPFNWVMTNVITEARNITAVNELSINQASFKGDLAETKLGVNFRFVFELWFYDQNVDQLSFAWNVANTRESVWTQLWFNALAVSTA